MKNAYRKCARLETRKIVLSFIQYILYHNCYVYFILLDFISFFVSVVLLSFRFGSFRFVSFCLDRFRFVLVVDLVSFHFVSFCFVFFFMSFRILQVPRKQCLFHCYCIYHRERCTMH